MPPVDPLLPDPEVFAVEELEFVVVAEVEAVVEEAALVMVLLDEAVSDCQLICIMGAYTVMSGMATVVAIVAADPSLVVVAATVTVPGTVKRP
jgi:hypothetical protein